MFSPVIFTQDGKVMGSCSIFKLKTMAMKSFFLLAFLSFLSLSEKKFISPNTGIPGIQTGASQLHQWAPALKGKKIGLVVNHTATVGNTHLADTLRSLGLNIVKIFSPEHGFRGNADAGEHIQDGIDSKTGLPVISLYGENRKPRKEQISDLDILIFDIQDVGVRFYTYISTLHYVMEACAENQKKLMVLDRPNPNGNYVDGPIRKDKFKSFVGMHPIPVVHGLTIGELAFMINGEKWLADGLTCDLEVVSVKNWKHDQPYPIPVKPSPNLPNDQAIKLYPSLCFFEGTAMSVGRGTLTPFQILGHPSLKNMPFEFTPKSIEGMAKNPKFENEKCYGLDLTQAKVLPQLNIQYLIDFYNQFPEKDEFFNNYFNKLAGNSELKEQIIKGLSAKEIRSSWKTEIDAYLKIRKKYLRYP